MRYIFFLMILIILGCNEDQPKELTGDPFATDIDTIPFGAPQALRVIPGTSWILETIDSLNLYEQMMLSQNGTTGRESRFTSTTLMDWIFSRASDSLNLVQYLDNDTIYQTLSISNDSLFISNGNGVSLAAYVGGGGSSGAAVTIPSYDSLRNYSGSATVAMVTDSRTSGLFYLSAGTENGGTQIGNWKRVFDGNTFQPEWWEVGGYNAGGIAAAIKNDCDALRSCVSVADTGGTISLMKHKTYEIDIAISIKPKQYFRGNGATLKRKSTPVATLTGSESAGSTLLEISDTTGFRAGQRIMVLDVSDANSGKAFDENDGIANQLLISSVGASSLSLSGSGLNNSGYVTGDKVVVISSIITEVSSQDYSNLIFEHVNFDGNRSGNDETYDWRFNWSVALGTGKNVTFRACNFYDTPCENITFGSGIVDGCDFRNMNGSGVHISSSGDFVGVKLFNSTFNNVNEIGNALMNHSEAAFTFSANSVGVQVNNCRFENGGGAVIGTAGADDYELIFTDCFARNFSSLFTQTSSTTAERKSYFKFTDNTFDNCGDFIMSGNNVRQGNSINKIDFVGNSIVNGRMYLRHVSQAIFDHNNWYYDTTGFTPWPTSITAQDAYIQFLDFDQITFSNNQVIGPLENNPEVKNGLLFQHNNLRRRDGTGAETNYLYPQNIKIIGNTVANFTQGITTQPSSSRAATSTYQAVGWEIANNIVYVTRDVINGNETMGLLCESGVYCHDNIVYMPDTLSTSNSIGLIALGPVSAFATLMGAIVKDNIVYGPTATVQALRVGNTGGTCNYNVICVNNIICKSVQGTTFANSYVADNIIMSSAILPSYTTPAVPLVADWEEYKNVY